MTHIQLIKPTEADSQERMSLKDYMYLLFFRANK